MTLSNFIKTQDGDLINTDHIVQIVAETYYRADTVRNSIEYLVKAVVDCKPENNRHSFCKADEIPIFIESSLTLVDDYDEELSAEYWNRLWDIITPNLERITDYALLLRLYDRWFAANIDAIKNHETVFFEIHQETRSNNP